MVVVEQEDGTKFYIDGKLAEQLEKIRKRVNIKDEDFFWAVDGEEGSGKSVLTLQLAKFVDSSFCLERICFTPTEFRQCVQKAKKGQAIVFDEAFRGLSSRSAISQVNRLLIQLMMECRQKNLFIFLTLPSFFLLDKYAALWRCKGLFHVYRRGVQRGFWAYFNKKKKKLLYLYGKKTYTYTKPRSNFRGRFLEQYTVDEKRYRQKKLKALERNEHDVPQDRFSVQRDVLIYVMYTEYGVPQSQISRFLSHAGFKITRSAVSLAVKREIKRRKGSKSSDFSVRVEE